MSQSEAPDRRQHQRVETEMACTLVGAEGEKDAFELLDLSESGVRMRCGRNLAAMTRIQVAMLLPAGRIGRGDDVRLDTEGVVVWSHQTAGGSDESSIFDIGVFFPNIDDDQRGLLQAFVLSAV